MAFLDRTTKLRVRRTLRRKQRQVEAVTSRAEERFDKQFIDRLERLLDVQRFVIGWLFLVVAISVLTVLQTVGLNQYHLKFGPVAGGIYTEGMVGSYTNANPIYATGPVDTSVSRLLFSGLFKYDDLNHLVGDLAQSYQVDESGRQYTVNLKQNLRWHDGTPLTSRDVVFTYNLIQNPDARSPLFSSWQGISVSAPNLSTVIFQLPGALTAFPYSLTTGIIPMHKLAKVPASQLRTDSFNTTAPVGAGPFQWDTLQLGSSIQSGEAVTLISMKAFDEYVGGKPKLEGFVLHVFDSEEQLVAAYKKRSVEAMAGLKFLPKSLQQSEEIYTYEFSTTAATMVFFKTSEGILSDAVLRQALIQGADQNEIIKRLGGVLKPVKSPFLAGQIGYDKAYEQAAFNPASAATQLEQAGWTRGKDGKRSKNGQPLQFQIVAEETPDNQIVLKELQESWKGLGITMIPVLQTTTDFQSAVETHSYTALLYGISIGADPDVYAYWSSTQADVRSSNRLNFSEYKSALADTALEGGRTRQDPLVRALKYKPFLKAWQEDAPALGLYQPRSLYITRGPIAGLEIHQINTDADRYYSVGNWTVKTGHIPK